MKKIIVFLIAFGFSFSLQVYACTSAIISGRVTPDGKPLLWKHRDSLDPGNRLAYFKEGKYEFIGLVDRNDMNGKYVWMGCNTAGFSIMNTLSNNLKAKDDTIKRTNRGALIMHEALAICKNLKDFENYLDSISKPYGLESNFGVIDAEGGGAYYEVSNFTWTKFDVNDPVQAPKGYLIRSNFSFSGRVNEREGYIRYNTAEKMLSSASGDNHLTPEFIFGTLPRQFYNSEFDYDPAEYNQYPLWLIDQDYIPRAITHASIVVQGVRKGEDSRHAILWTLLGYPPCTMIYPVSMQYPDVLPAILTASDTLKVPLLYEMSMQLKQKVFPIAKEKGDTYLRYNLLYNQDHTGITQRILKAEVPIIGRAKCFISANEKKTVTRTELQIFYQGISGEIIRMMQLLNNSCDVQN